MVALPRWSLVIFVLLGNFWFADSVGAEKLKVGTKYLPPFVFVNAPEQQPKGYSIELWEKIGAQLGQEYEFVVFDSVTEMLNAVETQEVDLAIAGISITAEREKIVNFSHSYYETGLGILILDEPDQTITILLSYAFSWETLKALLILFGMAFISANVVWIFERRPNPDMFPDSYCEGIWEAFWWSLVTATTVGYGDKSPKGVMGRLVAISWMLGAIFVVSHFIAVMTADRIQSSISRLADLYEQKVGIVSDTASITYLGDHPLNLMSFTQRQEAYQALKKGKVKAVIDDAPTLLYFAAQNPDFRVVSSIFAKQDYGIAFPADSAYLESVNRILLQLQERGELEALNQKWFPSSE